MAAEPVDVGNATTADVWPSAATLNLFATNVDLDTPRQNCLASSAALGHPVAHRARRRASALACRNDLVGQQGV